MHHLVQTTPLPVPTSHCNSENPTGLQGGEGGINKARNHLWHQARLSAKPQGLRVGIKVRTRVRTCERAAPSRTAVPFHARQNPHKNLHKAHSQSRLASLCLKLKSDLVEPTRSPPQLCFAFSNTHKDFIVKPKSTRPLHSSTETAWAAPGRKGAPSGVHISAHSAPCPPDGSYLTQLLWRCPLPLPMAFGPGFHLLFLHIFILAFFMLLRQGPWA